LLLDRTEESVATAWPDELALSAGRAAIAVAYDVGSETAFPKILTTR
jgi:hypothetical protein